MWFQRYAVIRELVLNGHYFSTGPTERPARSPDLTPLNIQNHRFIRITLRPEEKHHANECYQKCSTIFKYFFCTPSILISPDGNCHRLQILFVWCADNVTMVQFSRVKFIKFKGS
jgi:hypothetical protein